MAVGMVVVFLFLGTLVAAMYGSAALFRRFAHLFPEERYLLHPETDEGALIAAAIAAAFAKRAKLQAKD
jgi:Na+-transporting methylmalonyl-CoA/oxaloacetate decarboxylase gamma subunit